MPAGGRKVLGFVRAGGGESYSRKIKRGKMRGAGYANREDSPDSIGQSLFPRATSALDAKWGRVATGPTELGGYMIRSTSLPPPVNAARFVRKWRERFSSWSPVPPPMWQVM